MGENLWNIPNIYGSLDTELWHVSCILARHNSIPLTINPLVSQPSPVFTLFCGPIQYLHVLPPTPIPTTMACYYKCFFSRHSSLKEFQQHVKVVYSEDAILTFLKLQAFYQFTSFSCFYRRKWWGKKRANVLHKTRALCVLLFKAFCNSRHRKSHHAN